MYTDTYCPLGLHSSSLVCVNRSRRYKVNKVSCPVPQEPLMGCSKNQKQLKTAPPLTTDGDCPTPEELPLPTQDGAPPTAPPTSTPLSLPATRPTREVSLKESVGLVAAYQSLTEQPEEYLPHGGMIDKKILDKYFFGYSVSVLCATHTTDSLCVSKLESCETVQM